MRTGASAPVCLFPMLKIASVAIAVSAAIAANFACAEAVRPVDDSIVLLKVATAVPQYEGLRALQEKLSADPDNLESAIALALNAIEIGRSNGDPRAYGQAQAALAPWWTDANPPEQVMILRAKIQQAFHAFEPALSDLDKVIANAPGNVQARFSRAFVRMVTGDYQNAADDCAALRARAAIMIREICQARIGALTGQGASSFKRLQASVQFGGANPAMTKFAGTVLAEIAVSLGDTTTAEALYRDAVADGSQDVSTLAAYADLMLASHRPQEVLQLLDGKGEADAVLLRRIIAARQTNDPRFSDWSAIQTERFAAAKASNNRVHLREEARYQLEVLNDAKTALPLAIENWRTQKEPADAALLLAAAIGTGDLSAAAPVSEFVTSAGLNDARLAPLLKKLKALSP